MTGIYLDHNATTPVAPPVADAMTSALRAVFGNPSSVHAYGQEAKTALDEARAAVARLIGAEPTEIVFTSGGFRIEQLGHSRRRGGRRGRPGRRHLVASAIEHEAVLRTLKALHKGRSTTLVAVDERGVVAAERLAAALTDETALVSIMHANNEIGTIQPIAELAALAHERGALMHTDAVQSVGKIPVDVRRLGVDLLSLSGHKFNGPKGAGILWIRRGTRLHAQMTGGRQERNRRAGTENLPAIVGLGAAARRLLDKPESATDLAALRDRLEAGILATVSGAAVNGASPPRVGNTSNISFHGVEAESLLIALDLEGIAVSTGSACSSGTLEPSHVLRAMGFSPHRTQNSIRFSLGLGNTADEVDRVVAVLPGIIDRLRALAGRGAAAVGR